MDQKLGVWPGAFVAEGKKKRSDGVLYSGKSASSASGGRAHVEKPNIWHLGLKMLVCALRDILCKTEILV